MDLFIVHIQKENIIDMLTRISGKNACPICDKLASVVVYADKENIHNLSNADSFDGYCLSCRNCGFGMIKFHDNVCVGASNDADYVINRFGVAEKMQKFVQSPYWVGTDIGEIIDAWNEGDRELQKLIKKDRE